MGDPEHGIFNRGPRKSSAQLHTGARDDVSGFGEDLLEPLVEELPRRRRVGGRDRRTFFTNRRLERVREGIDPGMGRHREGHRQGQLGVENGEDRRRLRIPTSHLRMGLRIGDEGKTLTLTPRPRGRRDRDKGQHRQARLAYAPVVLHATAVGQDKIATLRRVETRSAAEAHDQIRLRPASRRDTTLDILGRGILPDLIIHRHGETRRRDGLHRPDHRARPGDAGIGHDEDPFRPQRGDLVPQYREGARTEDDATACGMLETDHPVGEIETIAERLNRKGVGRHRGDRSVSGDLRKLE